MHQPLTLPASHARLGSCRPCFYVTTNGHYIREAGPHAHPRLAERLAEPSPGIFHSPSGTCFIFPTQTHKVGKCLNTKVVHWLRSQKRIVNGLYENHSLFLELSKTIGNYLVWLHFCVYSELSLKLGLTSSSQVYFLVAGIHQSLRHTNTLLSSKVAQFILSILSSYAGPPHCSMVCSYI